MKSLSNFIKGIFIGSGAILPGISSGVICMVLGLYEKLLDSVLNFFKDRKEVLYMPRTKVDIIGYRYRQINDFIRGELRRQKIPQIKLAEYLGISQAALSLRLNGTNEWPLRDFLETMEFLKQPLEIL